MKKLVLGIERNQNDDLNVFQSKLRKLIIDKNLIPKEQANQLELLDLLQYVVVVWLPDTDYKKICEVVAKLEAEKNVS